MPIWSKLKRAVEGLLADSVRRHLQLYMTHYGPGVSYFMARAWVTWDGREIAAFSTIQHWRERTALVRHLQTGNVAIASRLAEEQADTALEERGVFSQSAFYDALTEYISLSIGEALRSPNTLIRAWSMFDRRLGKRRLRTLRIIENDAALVRQCYQLRLEAEGIAPDESR